MDKSFSESAAGTVRFTAEERSGCQSFSADFGAVTNLTSILGPDGWQIAHNVLLAESERRESFLNNHVQPGHTVGTDWRFSEFRRVSYIPFIPSMISRASSVLDALGLDFELFTLVQRSTVRQCPRCHTPLEEPVSVELVSPFTSRLHGRRIAVAIDTGERSDEWLSRGFVYTIADGAITRLTPDSAPGTIVIDYFSFDGLSTRLADAIQLAVDLKSTRIAVLSESEKGFEPFLTRTVGLVCPDCAFQASRADRTSFRNLASRPTAERDEFLGSFLLNDISLLELLSAPLERSLPGVFPDNLCSKSWSLLLGQEISLLSPVSALSEREIQTLAILKLVFSQFEQSIIIIEEPYTAANDAMYQATSSLLAELSQRDNAVLVIDNARPPREDIWSENTSVQHAVQLEDYLLPGNLILAASDHPTTIGRLLQAIEFRGLNPPAAHLTLPSLSSLRASAKTIAELVGLEGPLSELYLRLPVSLRYGLTRAQLAAPPTPKAVPLFKGVQYQQALAMSIEDGQQTFANVPGCGNILSALMELGLGRITLNTVASLLAPGELSLIRLSFLNIRPARLRRIYEIDYPLFGMSDEQAKAALAMLKRLSAAGHTGVLIDRDQRFRGLVDQSLNFNL